MDKKMIKKHINMSIFIVMLLIILSMIILTTVWFFCGEYKTLRCRGVEFINSNGKLINLSSEECNEILGTPLSVNDEYILYDAGYISHDRFFQERTEYTLAVWFDDDGACYKTEMQEEFIPWF